MDDHQSPFIGPITMDFKNGKKQAQRRAAAGQSQHKSHGVIEY